MTAPRTGRAVHDGVAIGYEVHDAGDTSWPWLVAIQGLGYARWGWGPVTALLAEGRRLVLLDNRGIGDSDVPPGPYDAATMAGDVLAVLDDLEVVAADVVGLSLGGMIAQELAIAHPDRVDRLVLVATSPGGAAAHPMPASTVELLEQVASLPAKEALHRLVANAFAPDVAAARPDLVAAVVARRLAAPQDPAGWQAQAAAGTTYDGSGRQTAITAPTLVVHGDADRVIDVANAAVLADLVPGARLAVVAGGGHVLPLERPHDLAGLIAAHLDGSSARERTDDNYPDRTRPVP